MWSRGVLFMRLTVNQMVQGSILVGPQIYFFKFLIVFQFDLYIWFNIMQVIMQVMQMMYFEMSKRRVWAGHSS